MADFALTPVTKETAEERLKAETLEARAKAAATGSASSGQKLSWTPSVSALPSPSKRVSIAAALDVDQGQVDDMDLLGSSAAAQDAEVAAINANDAALLPAILASTNGVAGPRARSALGLTRFDAPHINEGTQFALNAFTGGANKWSRNVTRLRRKQSREAAAHKVSLSDFSVPITGAHPFDIHALELLRATAKRVMLPKGHGRVKFKKLLLSARSAKVLEHTFWHVHVALNGMGPEEADEIILDKLCASFVEFFWSIPDPRERDYFLENFPCAVGAAIIHGCAVHFPSSSGKTSATPFRAQCHREVRHLFTGSLDDERMALAHAKRLKLDGPPPGSTESAIAEVTRGKTDDVLDDEEARIAASGGDLLTGVPGIKVPETGDLIPPGAQVIRVKTLPRPPRVWFDAGAKSPLVVRYVRLAGQGAIGGPQQMRVRRSTPVPGCLVGSEASFKATPDRRSEQAQLTMGWRSMSRAQSRMARDLYQITKEQMESLEAQSSGVLGAGRRSNEVTDLAKKLTATRKMTPLPG